MNKNPTIFALASAPGRSGVAVVRVSGPGAGDSLRLLTGRAITPRAATLCRLRDPVSHETIDQALVLLFTAPASYTGEDVAEYHLHGSPAVVRSLLAFLARQPGHRMAEPGEFTRRAFEHGKLDLTEAEAVADLIDAETEAQKAQALEQLGGALSALYDGWREKLTRALAHIEADIDFPDEDLPDGVAAQVRPVLAALAAELDDHLSDNRRGERLRDGIQVVVIGAPNAGKSSLVNALARRDVAIVSAQAGTTRDVIEVHLNIGGYPVIIADTAGLRPDQIGSDGHDAIESEGIRRALKRAAEADIRLLLFDAGTLPDVDPHTMALADKRALVAVNKADLNPDAAALLSQKLTTEVISISVSRETGLADLTAALVARIEKLMERSRPGPSLTRERHRTALTECRAALGRAMTAHLPELAAEDVRLAVRALGRITGRVDVEDLLDVIFRDFCIGK
jgi:tRNA modification GTPase